MKSTHRIEKTGGCVEKTKYVIDRVKAAMGENELNGKESREDVQDQENVVVIEVRIEKSVVINTGNAIVNEIVNEIVKEIAREIKNAIKRIPNTMIENTTDHHLDTETKNIADLVEAQEMIIKAEMIAMQVFLWVNLWTMVNVW